MGKGRSGHDDNFGIGLCSIFFMSSGNATVIMCIAEVIQVVVLCWTIVPTERALKDNFDQDGNRKDK